MVEDTMRGTNRLERALGFLLAVILLVGTFAVVASAQSGTVTVTRSNVSPLKVYRITIRWTSTAGGAVNTNPISIPHGQLLQVKFQPDAGGTQPTDLYDVTLVDDNGLDYLSGRGANLSNATPIMFQWDPPVMWHTSQSLDLVVTNAGNAKRGTVTLWVRAQ